MNKKPRPLLKLLWFGSLVLIAATMLMPFVWQAMTSLKPLGEVEGGGLFPRQWLPRNYVDVFRRISYGRYYANSLVVAAATTVLQVLSSSMAAFSFSRLVWRGRSVVFLAYLGTMMIPGVVTMIPNFALMLKLHLYDTYAGLIIPSAFSAFGTFMMRQFMLTVSPALDEAARIDGASEWQLFWDIVLPLCRPGLIALSVLTFLGSYGSLYWPLVMTRSERLRTLPIGLLFFDSSHGPELNLLMAASLMAIIPSIVLFVTLQKYIVSGLQAGGVKG